MSRIYCKSCTTYYARNVFRRKINRLREAISDFLEKLPKTDWERELDEMNEEELRELDSLLLEIKDKRLC